MRRVEDSLMHCSARENLGIRDLLSELVSKHSVSPDSIQLTFSYSKNFSRIYVVIVIYVVFCVVFAFFCDFLRGKG